MPEKWQSSFNESTLTILPLYAEIPLKMGININLERMVKKMDFNQENNEQELDETTSNTKFKQWLQDNMRIIISILIVVLIAGGIYSYSKRTEESLSIKEIVTEENQVDEDEVAADEKISTTEKNTEKNETEKTTFVSVSQETEKSFIETAAQGDSQTKLARKALANFLEKNPDAGLTAEHKIYIEDYLRKNVRHEGRVIVGTSIEFSKDLIKDAISQSKTLTDNQLQNLSKYAVRVPTLS